jgi:hypothetical protein
MEAKQLVQALPQILKENLGWFEATRLARHLRNFGADVEIRDHRGEAVYEHYREFLILSWSAVGQFR